MRASAVWIAGLLASTTTVTAGPLLASRDNDKSGGNPCQALWQSAPKHLADLTVLLAEDVPAGSTINETARGDFIPVGTELGPFCRFAANITTSPTSSVRFEVWLPQKKLWNGHFSTVGNGGASGYVRYDQMQVPLAKYGFAVASTNRGHDGAGGDGSYALNNPESQNDFGYRAVHLTTVYGKKIVELYYGKKHKLAVWNGCSSGGAQALKEVQMYPNDYDAVLAGAPAWEYSALGGFGVYENAIINNPNATATYIAPSNWASIHREVMSQCDSLDGLADGIITQPGKCNLDYSRFLCGSSSTIINATTCLTPEQVNTMRLTYTDWVDPRNGEFIFPANNIGAEAYYSRFVTGTPYGASSSYFVYQVLNSTELVYPVLAPPVTIDGQRVTETQLIDLVREGQRINPGGAIAGKYDISEFFKRGGKLIHYHGASDALIPTNASHYYRTNMLKATGDVSNSYQYYEIPGMGHCTGGVSAFNFGQASQLVDGTNQGAVFDEKHDILLALLAWREKGIKPEAIIGAKYVGDLKKNGTAFTRPICPWPAYSAYIGGDQNDASSFECRK